MTTTNKKFNGWKNYNTWNVALWINADEGLTSMIEDYEARKVTKKQISEILGEFLLGTETGDGVKFTRTTIRAAIANR